MSDEVIAVVGLGFLGRGIVASLLIHGHRVIAFDRSGETLALAERSISLAIEEAVEHGAAPRSVVAEWRGRCLLAASISELAPATFVIESITENAELKSRAFDEIEQVVADDVPVASNTSAIPISALQATRRRPERFLGMHWAEPAHATRFLELIRGEHTGDAAFARASRLAANCGKEASVINRDIPGFIANRLGYAVYREALHLLGEGIADAETIDRSFRNSIGLWATLCGPFRWMDLTGGPSLYAEAMSPVLPTLSSDQEISSPMEQLRSENARGIANGRGFYNYSAEAAEAWEGQYRRHAWRMKEIVDELRPLGGGR